MITRFKIGVLWRDILEEKRNPNTPFTEAFFFLTAKDDETAIKRVKEECAKQSYRLAGEPLVIARSKSAPIIQSEDFYMNEGIHKNTDQDSDEL